MQIKVALLIVSHETNLRTKLFYFLILALEKLRDIVTARGSPSGIAQHIKAIRIMIVSSNSVHSRLSTVNSNVKGLQDGTDFSHLKMF